MDTSPATPTAHVSLPAEDEHFGHATGGKVGMWMFIAQDGMVTLKGPVRSEAEKTTIEQKAVAVVGQAKVTNLIEIEP